MNWWTRQREIPRDLMHRRCVVAGRVALGVLVLPYLLAPALVRVTSGLPYPGPDIVCGVLMTTSAAVAVLCGFYSWIAWWTFCDDMQKPRCGIAAAILGTPALLFFGVLLAVFLKHGGMC
jgi:hypothetical protein